MDLKYKTKEQLEIEELRSRLTEIEEAIRAIRNGEAVLLWFLAKFHRA
jgi:hypothetical protein